MQRKNLKLKKLKTKNIFALLFENCILKRYCWGGIAEKGTVVCDFAPMVFCWLFAGEYDCVTYLLLCIGAFCCCCFSHVRRLLIRVSLGRDAQSCCSFCTHSFGHSMFLCVGVCVRLKVTQRSWVCCCYGRMDVCGVLAMIFFRCCCCVYSFKMR